MASAAFKYVPQPAATTFALHSVLFLFYGFLVQGTTSSDDLCLTFCVIFILWCPGSGWRVLPGTPRVISDSSRATRKRLEHLTRLAQQLMRDKERRKLEKRREVNYVQGGLYFNFI